MAVHHHLLFAIDAVVWWQPWGEVCKSGQVVASHSAVHPMHHAGVYLNVDHAFTCFMCYNSCCMLLALICCNMFMFAAVMLLFLSTARTSAAVLAL